MHKICLFCITKTTTTKLEWQNTTGRKQRMSFTLDHVFQDPATCLHREIPIHKTVRAHGT